MALVLGNVALDRSQWPPGPRRGLAGARLSVIAGSNPAGVMDACLF